MNDQISSETTSYTLRLNLLTRWNFKILCPIVWPLRL